MLDLLFSNLPAFIISFGGLLISISLHEAAHCYMADRLGDPTPRLNGRVTLNPLAHLDPLGTLIILVTGFFGWGKPSPYDPYNLANPKRDSALIALAGPVTNVLIAIVIALILKVVDTPENVWYLIVRLIQVNLGLALFNLLPVPPLDGSKILGAFLSHENSTRLQSSTNPIFLILLILPLIGGVSIASLIISPILNVLLSILLH